MTIKFTHKDETVYIFDNGFINIPNKWWSESFIHACGKNKIEYDTYYSLAIRYYFNPTTDDYCTIYKNYVEYLYFDNRYRVHINKITFDTLYRQIVKTFGPALKN